jgi:hypothetical protein
MHGIAEMKVSETGKPRDLLNLLFTLVWIRDGAWRLFLRQATRMPQVGPKSGPSRASLMGPVMSSRPVRQILVSASVYGHSSFLWKERSSIGQKPPHCKLLPMSRQPVTCFSPWSAQRLPA